MTHIDVYKQFESYFPRYAKDYVEAWFPNGHNCVRIRQKNHQEFIFTFNDRQSWRFETVKSFVDGIKRRQK